MNKWRNGAALSVAALLAASLLTGSGSASAASGFTDIGNSASKDKIEALYEAGIVKGETSTLFDPTGELNGAQGISLIVRTLSLSLAAIDFNTAPQASAVFTHIDDKAWYADSFLNAHFNGVEIPADIDPQQSLTREQFVHYLVQGIESTGQYPVIKMFIPIGDEDEIDASYQGTIQRALLYKVASLDDEGNFNPKAVVTREEAAAMLYDARQFVQSHQASDMKDGLPLARG